MSYRDHNRDYVGATLVVRGPASGVTRVSSEEALIIQDMVDLFRDVYWGRMRS